MFDRINQQVSKYIALSEEETILLNSLLEFKKVPKKPLLLHEGDVCNFEAFINKGCIRSYYIDEHGAEVILQFSIEDWWVSDIASDSARIFGCC